MYNGYDTYEDFFNRNKKRNIKNTYKWAYNCAGYALRCFSWYVPDHYFYYCDKEEIFNEMVEHILEDFPNLVLINKLEDVSPKTEVIAFRIDYKGQDIHFLRRSTNGHWYHKRGALNSIDTIKVKEVLSDYWCERYTGKIAWFVER